MNEFEKHTLKKLLFSDSEHVVHILQFSFVNCSLLSFCRLKVAFVVLILMWENSEVEPCVANEQTNEGKGGEGYLEGKATKLNDQSHNTVKEKKRFALRTVKNLL